jgi:mannose-6-phosphate isomerase-like protein (cupin superfamily)
MSVVRAAEAPTFNLPGIRFVGLTAPSRGASEICTWHLHVEPHTPGGEPHWLDHEEVFILLEGTLRVMVDDELVSLAAGDALAVPANAHLHVSNPEDAPAHALVCVPAGFQAFTQKEQLGTPPWAQ